MSSNINFISLARKASKRHYDHGHGDNKEGVMSDVIWTTRFSREGCWMLWLRLETWDLREREREVVFKLSFLFPRLLYMFYLSCVIHLNVNKREWYVVNWSKIHICVYMLYFFPLSCYKWEEYKSKSSWRKELNKIIELQASWDVYIIISFLFEQKVYSNLTKL